MFKIAPLLILLMPVFTFCQSTISMPVAIQLALENSLVTQGARLEVQRAEEEYKLLSKDYLPSLKLLSSIPVISKTTSRITLPSGEDVFVNQNQVFNDFSLALNMREPLFNGHLEITSRLNRIDILGDVTSTSYYATPISIAYHNDNFFFDDYEWQRRLSRQTLDVERRSLEQSYNQVATRVVKLYFDNLASANRLQLNEFQKEGLSQILLITKERFHLGTVSRSEILSLEVELLEIANDIEQNRINNIADKQALELLIGVSIDALDTTLNNLMPGSIVTRIEHQLRYTNTLESIQLEQERISLEYEQSRVKNEDLVSLSINGAFGLSNTGDQFTSSLQNLVNQQRYSITFGLTLLDFGKRKAQMKIIGLKQESLNLRTQDQRGNFELEVQALVNKIDNSTQLVQILTAATELADENYQNLLQRFPFGNIEVSTIIDAREKCINLHQKYIETLRSYWVLLFELQEKTNYDFLQQVRASY